MPKYQVDIPHALAVDEAKRRISGATEKLQRDYGATCAWKGDTEGNLIYRKTARNFNPNMATAGRVTIAEVEILLPAGELDPDQIHTPGIFVTRIIDGSPYQKIIEKRTLRKRTEASHAVVA